MGKYYPGGVRVVIPTLHLIRYYGCQLDQWGHLNANYNIALKYTHLGYAHGYSGKP